MQPTISIGAAAAGAGMSIQTLRRLAKAGKVRSILQPSGRYRFDPAHLEADLKASNPYTRIHLPRYTSLSVTDAARLTGLSAGVLIRLADRGRIPCERLESGHRRFDRDKLLGALSEQHRILPQIPVPLLPDDATAMCAASEFYEQRLYDPLPTPDDAIAAVARAIMENRTVEIVLPSRKHFTLFAMRLVRRILADAGIGIRQLDLPSTPERIDALKAGMIDTPMYAMAEGEQRAWEAAQRARGRASAVPGPGPRSLRPVAP